MTDYIADLTNPTPAFRRDAERLAQEVQSNASICDGVLRWHSNASVPPMDIVRLAAHVMPGRVDVDACQRAARADLEAFRRQAIANDRPMSGEELAEARNAHGRGARLVNVLTGRVTIT